MAPSVPPPAPIREPERGPVGILVVDDEEPIRNALRRFLTMEKYDVHTAATGAEGLDIVGSRRIGCVLLDLRLPDEPGTDLVPQFLDQDPDLAILVLTAVNDAATASLWSPTIAAPASPACSRGCRSTFCLPGG